jgi:NADH-quinone oxidoreductase subunit B
MGDENRKIVVPLRDAKASQAECSFLKQGMPPASEMLLLSRYDFKSSLLGWARRNSLWPLPFGTACCAIEFMAAVAAHFDMSRFGAELVRFSPRQADMLIVAGTITNKQASILRRIWEQMAMPKWVIALGACTCSGGIFKTYSVLQGIDKVIPVDVYVPGCPPRPEALIYGFLKLQKRIGDEAEALMNS